MAVNRLETLKSMLAQDPQNSFARYGIAMEYANSGQLEEAVAEFQALLGSNPDYAAAYFHCGQTLEKLGRTEDAATMYRQGIDTASRLGDLHTRSELQQALDMLV